MLDSNSFTKDLVVELERCAKNYSDDNNAISSESKTIVSASKDSVVPISRKI